MLKFEAGLPEEQRKNVYSVKKKKIHDLFPILK